MALNAFGGLRDLVRCLRSGAVMPQHATAVHLSRVPPCHSMKCSAGNGSPARAAWGEIMLWAERVATLGERYSAFATELRLLAKNYRTRAIVQFVERHLEGEHAS